MDSFELFPDDFCEGIDELFGSLDGPPLDVPPLEVDCCDGQKKRRVESDNASLHKRVCQPTKTQPQECISPVSVADLESLRRDQAATMAMLQRMAARLEHLGDAKKTSPTEAPSPTVVSNPTENATEESVEQEFDEDFDDDSQEPKGMSKRWRTCDMTAIFVSVSVLIQLAFIFILPLVFKWTDRDKDIAQQDPIYPKPEERQILVTSDPAKTLNENKSIFWDWRLTTIDGKTMAVFMLRQVFPNLPSYIEFCASTGVHPAKLGYVRHHPCASIFIRRNKRVNQTFRKDCVMVPYVPQKSSWPRAPDCLPTLDEEYGR